MRAKMTASARATAAMLAGLPNALAALVLLAVTPLLLLGLLITPEAIRPIRRLADAERDRLSKRLGRPIPSPYWQPRSPSHRDRVGTVIADPATWRDVVWLLLHGVGWTGCALIAVALWPAVLVSVCMPLYWTAFPPGTFTALLVPVSSWPLALTLPFLQGVLYAVIIAVVLPPASRAFAGRTADVLRPTLATEVERLAHTRAAALESHGAELRRIERDLHDGVQAHLVTISVRLGLAERAVLGNSDTAVPLIRDARTGIEDVLAELRSIVRGIYPPILNDRGLAGAMHALTADREIPVTVQLPDDLPRLPAPVEAAAYFVVAESLTNVTRHSAATRAEVIIEYGPGRLLLMVRDDGLGGAEEKDGSGLVGIRRRVAALDGRCTVDSPAGVGTRIEVMLPCGS